MLTVGSSPFTIASQNQRLLATFFFERSLIEKTSHNPKPMPTFGLYLPYVYCQLTRSHFLSSSESDMFPTRAAICMYVCTDRHKLMVMVYKKFCILVFLFAL